MKNCLPWVGPHTGAEEESKEEGGSETMCHELTITQFPVPLCYLGEEAEKLGLKLSPGRRKRWEEGVFKIWFYF